MSRPVQHIHHHGSGLGYLVVLVCGLAVAGEAAGRAVSPHPAASAAVAPKPEPARTVIVEHAVTHYVSRSPVSGTPTS